MNELVSIIIPIYNVEKYLKDCIDSVINQSYREIEIILVNDGSTDLSYEICLEYKKRDKRIKVINKPNGGLSTARNEGIERANGNYLVFIDSDDFVDNKMIETLMKAVKYYNAEIVCCNYDFVDENSNYIKKHKIRVKTNLEYTREEAQDLLLYSDYFRCYAWNKIYKKELFENVRYPDGKIYEDIYTTFRLFEKSKKIVFLKKSLYHYRVRINSITRNINKEKLYDILDPIRKINRICDRKEVKIGILLYYRFFFDDLIKIKKWDDIVYCEFEKIAKKNMGNILKNVNMDCIEKIRLILLLYSKNLYRILYYFLWSLNY